MIKKSLLFLTFTVVSKYLRSGAMKFVPFLVLFYKGKCDIYDLKWVVISYKLLSIKSQRTCLLMQACSNTFLDKFDKSSYEMTMIVSVFFIVW